MPKELLSETRYDFRGGLNTSASPFALRANELSVLKNAVLDLEHGGIAKRGGARKLNTGVLTGQTNILGIRQWFDEAVGSISTVLIHNGVVWFRNGSNPVGVYSQGTGTGLSTTEPPILGVARTVTANADAQLYVASNGFFRWVNGVLTSLGGAAGVPSDIDFWAPYHTRAFWHAKDRLSAMVWSQLGNPEVGTSGGAEGGGEAMFGYTRGDAIKRMITQGGSLLIASDEAIGRFTGYSDIDIQIAQDSEGVSFEVGTLGLRTFEAIEDFAITLDSRGVYAVTEGGVTPIALNIERNFLDLDRDNLSSAIVGYDKGTRTAFIAVPGMNDGGVNKTLFGLTLGAINAWTGPWTVPFEVHSIGSVEDTNGSEFLAIGCEDGFARILGDPSENTDDGTLISMEVQFAPFFWGKPAEYKSLRGIHLDATIAEGTFLEVQHRFDNEPFETTLVTGAGESHYRVDLHGQGYQMDLRIVSNDLGRPRIRGLVANAWAVGRD